MKESKTKEIYPFDISSCGSEAECGDCNEKKDLNCIFSYEKLLQFYDLFLPFAIPAIVGVHRSGYSFYLLGWLIMAIVFFGF